MSIELRYSGFETVQAFGFLLNFSAANKRYFGIVRTRVGLDLIIITRFTRIVNSVINIERNIHMDIQVKIGALENRLNVLIARGKDNQGVCRRIQREIRNLKKQLPSQSGEAQ